MSTRIYPVKPSLYNYRLGEFYSCIVVIGAKNIEYWYEVSNWL
jgi:hypothetical protein